MSMTKQTTKLQITYLHIQSLFVHCLEFTIPTMKIAKLKVGSVAEQTSLSFVDFGDHIS